ncbi:MAG TPA: ribonuclease HI family protein [Terriglobia bacterium]|nr:ribonuclease HI family protein [Terriglobia bacterium]
MSAKVPETQEVVAHIDGGSRGNPGPAAYGVVVCNAEGTRLASFSKFLGCATNNVAEYQGLLAALGYALEHRHSRLKVVSDSELLARQITGQYKVKNPDLKILHERARTLIAQLDSFSIKHVLREHNREADRLANEALDAAGGKKGAQAPRPATPPPLRASATYRQGVLRLDETLPLDEGEEVSVEIHRAK